MKFNVGDMVSFINEKLSGKITRIVNNEICKVEVEDGFELDVHEKELVLVSKAPSSELPSGNEIFKQEREKEDTVKGNIFDSLAKDAFYFITSPAGEMQVLTGPVNFFLVNRTSYHGLFTVSVKINEQLYGLKRATIRPYEEYLLFSKSRSEIVNWQHILLQALFYKEGAYERLPVLNKELAVSLPDLNTSFDKSKGSIAFSKVTKLVTSVIEIPPDLGELKRKYAEEKPMDLSARPQRKSPGQHNTFSPQAILRNDAEVDLHIQELVADYKNLSNGEMIQIQMKRFRREMDNALKNHYHKVVFIHGVGNGVLRNEILRELKTYQGVMFHDAPFEKYGYGATEVVLK